MIADGIVHADGIVLAIAAGAALLALSLPHTGPGENLAAAFYVVCPLTALSVSVAYNLWPLTPKKRLLRRFDHSAIYLLMAATYTPFLAQLNDRPLAAIMLAIVWIAALAGMAIKMLLPGRLIVWRSSLYLALGWSGTAILRPLFDTLRPPHAAADPSRRHRLLVERRFFRLEASAIQNALWHTFVVAGTGLDFAAVFDSLTIAQI